MMQRNEFPGLLTRFGIYLFAFSIPVSFVPAEFGIAIAFAGWCAIGFVNKRWEFIGHLFGAVWLAYIGWNVISCLASPRVEHSLLALVDNEWQAAIMFLMFWTVRSETILKRVVSLFLVVAAVVMVYAVWQTFSGVELYRNMPLTPSGPLFRSVGFYSFYLTFAGLASTVLMLSAGLAMETLGRERLVSMIVAVAAFAAIVGSFARSVWLSVAIALPLLGFSKGRRRGFQTVALLALVTLCLMAVVPGLSDRVLSIVDLEQNQTRLNLWRTSLAMSADRPLLGVGQDNFDMFFSQYRVQGYYDTATHPHNDYLNVLVSSGAPGLLAFVVLWILALREGIKTATKAKSPFVRGTALGASLGLLGYLVGSFFQDYYGTFANCLGWWFIVGLIFASSRCSSLPQVELARTSES